MSTKIPNGKKSQAIRAAALKGSGLTRKQRRMKARDTSEKTK